MILFFSEPSNIPLCKCAVVPLSSPLFLDSWVLSRFCLWWIVLQCRVHLDFGGSCPEVKLLYLMDAQFLDFWEVSIFSQKFGLGLVPFSTQPHQDGLFLSFVMCANITAMWRCCCFKIPILFKSHKHDWNFHGVVAPAPIAKAILRKKMGGFSFPNFKLCCVISIVIQTVRYRNKDRLSHQWNKMESLNRSHVDCYFLLLKNQIIFSVSEW